MCKVLTIGEVLVEIMTADVNQSLGKTGKLLGPYPSGAPAIFVDQVAKMGIDAGIVAKIGNDDFGKLVKTRLMNDGVNTDYIFSIDNYTTGTAFVTYFDSGERKFIYHFANSAAGQLCPEDIKEEYFKNVEYFHIMGCSLLANDCLRKSILKGLDICRKRNIVVSFDPNIRPELIAEEETLNIFQEILSDVNILLTGAKEFAVLYKEEVNKNVIINDLLNNKLQTIILKNGAEGVEIYDQKESYQYLAPYPVEEVDPTGAGDSFDGAFIASLVAGKTMKEAAKIANVAGALSVTKKGPMEGVENKEVIFDMMTKLESSL